MDFTKLIEALPLAGTNPFTFVSYALLIASSIYYFERKSRSKDLLKTLEMVAIEDRPKVAKAAGYSYDKLASLKPEERLKYLTLNHRLLVIFLITVAILIFSAIWFNQASSIRKTQADSFYENALREERVSNFQEACKNFNSANTLIPSRQIDAGLARSLIELNLNEDAYKHITLALQNDFKTENDLLAKSDLICSLAFLSRINGDATRAQQLLAEAIQIARPFSSVQAKRTLAKVTNNLANIHARAGSFEIAKALYLEAINLDIEVYDYGAEVKDRSNLATLFGKMGKPQDGIEILSKGLSQSYLNSDQKWKSSLLWKRARLWEPIDGTQANNDYLLAVSSIQLTKPIDRSLQAKICGDYAQFILEKGGSEDRVVALLVTALNGSFDTGDSHGVLAQTDGMFEYYKAHRQPKAKVVFGIAALNLASTYGSESDIEDVKSRVQAAKIATQLSVSGLDSDNLYESVCVGLFEFTGISEDRWRIYLKPFNNQILATNL